MSLRSYIPDPRQYFPQDEVYSIGLKSMESHLLMIDYVGFICKLFYFCINILPQVVALARGRGLFSFLRIFTCDA
jgi:hypothetical protein